MNARTVLWLLVGLGAVLALGAGGVVAMAAWKQYENARKWLPSLSAAEARFGIPTDLLARLAFQESSWRDDVIDGTTASPAGALGLMQLMPAYFVSVRVPRPFNDADTAAQIDEAAAQLVRLYDHYGDWQLAVAGYNAGRGRVDNYISGAASLPAETANYVAAIFADVGVST